jgi:hypothetical protein
MTSGPLEEDAKSLFTKRDNEGSIIVQNCVTSFMVNALDHNIHEPYKRAIQAG